MVRAKVDQIRLLQENLSAAEIKELTAHYIQSLKLVTHYLSPKKPELIIMFGFAGSGKSTIAKKMVSQIDAVQIRSDAERKRLFDLHRLHDTTSDVKQGLYSSDNTDLVYQYLLLLARYTLKAGYTAIIDATFLKYEHRQWFAALAKELNVPFNIVSCNASVGTLQERIVERNIKQHDISNSTLDVLQHQLETYDPLTEEELTFTTPSATS
jgi:predicted kinase